MEAVEIKLELEPGLKGVAEPQSVPRKSILKSVMPDEVISTSLAPKNQTPATDAAADTQTQPQQVTVHPTSLIYFSVHDSLKLKFPIGCPVMYDLEKLDFQQGLIFDVALDLASRKYLYKIQNDAVEGMFDLVPEERIAFGMNCPVKIELNGKTDVLGVVIGSHALVYGGTKIDTYAVIIATESGKSRMVRGVKSKNIQYIQTDEQTPNYQVGVKDYKPQVQSRQEPNMNSAKAPKIVSISSSIRLNALGDELKSRANAVKTPKMMSPICSNVLQVQNKKERKIMEDVDTNANSNSLSDKKQKVGTTPSLRLLVPSWALNAGKDVLGTIEAKRGDIEAKSNGTVTLESRAEGLEVSIASQSAAKMNEADVAVFNRELTDLLISYLNDNNCKGRLLYELARNSRGENTNILPISTGGSVLQKSVVVGEGDVWMDLVEIPCTVSENAKKVFDTLLSRISARYYGIQICLAVPRLCTNYILIYGKDQIKVEHAKLDVVRLVGTQKGIAEAGLIF